MSKSKRILFLDFMRVLALLMMIQGHTTYDFLDLSIRDGNSLGIQVWSSLRGYTAPFFMMVSGAVFCFLMISQEQPDGSNPRVKAGTKRIITLLFWGYLLNFPIYVIGKIFTRDGLDRFLNIRVGETLITIFGIAVALFIYKSLQSDEEEAANERAYIRHLFKRGGFNKDIALKARLLNRRFLRNEEHKKRLFSSFFYSVLISVPFLIISSLLSVEEKLRALRVDVLPIIALGLLTIMLVYFVSGKRRKLMALIYFVLILLFVGIYPIVNNVDFSNLPIFLSSYLNNFETRSMFTITPWLSFIFAGALMGLWLAFEIKRDNFEKIIGFKLLGIGLVLLLLSYFGDKFEIYYYGRSYYWHDSPNLVYHRMGIVMCVGSFMAFLSLFIKDLPLFLKQMSRNTLWLYVGHLVIIYQIVKPIIGYRTRFDVPIVLVFVITMYFLMYLQTRVIIYVQKNGGYTALFKKWVLRRKSKPADN